MDSIRHRHGYSQPVNRIPRVKPAAHPHHSRRHAFSAIEVVLLVVVIAIVAGVVLPAMRHPRRLANRIKCVNNLKNLGLTARIFAVDHEGKFSWQVPSQQGGSMEELGDPNRIWRHFQVLSNDLSTPWILHCPNDRRIAAPTSQQLSFSVTPGSKQIAFGHNDHVSYFLNVTAIEGVPQLILGGDRNLTRNGTPVTGHIRPGTNDAFAFTDPGHHKAAGNLMLGDGSVIQVSPHRVAAAFSDGFAAHQTNPPALLLIP